MSNEYNLTKWITYKHDKLTKINKIKLQKYYNSRHFFFNIMPEVLTHFEGGDPKKPQVAILGGPQILKITNQYVNWSFFKNRTEGKTRRKKKNKGREGEHIRARDSVIVI